MTCAVVLWHWYENPAGIFRDATDSHWPFMYDTAISWLIPTFLYTSLIVYLVLLIRAALKTR
ncbi:hypothetical protein QWY77_04135 [Thalassotalea ponticola]|uniref:hypothetical protein n=1 Tax=Thalassotalea ponticola TaxID=1523392 RepID=UPI0025B29647|nr:hypothetical protein [Thalassotalea ponticola]MDN3651956.1 hypothetical protein [Thalassotalea ponticola]